MEFGLVQQSRASSFLSQYLLSTDHCKKKSSLLFRHLKWSSQAALRVHPSPSLGTPRHLCYCLPHGHLYPGPLSHALLLHATCSSPHFPRLHSCCNQSLWPPAGPSASSSLAPVSLNCTCVPCTPVCSRCSKSARAASPGSSNQCSDHFYFRAIEALRCSYVLHRKGGF